jgi:small subunit ribosomal protein S16
MMAMLKIRLQRVGRVHEPTFRLVLTDSKNSTKSGRYLENLGNYDSRRGEKAEFKADRIKYWISTGAQTSTTVNNLLISKKIIEGKKLNALPRKKPIMKETAESTEAPAAEAPKEEAKEEVVEASEVVETPEEAPAESVA